MNAILRLRRRTRILSVAAAAAIVVAVIWAQGVLGGDARARACGADTNATVATFSVPAANQVRNHLPHMHAAPELDLSSSPAYVVLFRDPVELPVMGFSGSVTARTYSNVVCVFVDGRPEFYSNVDTSGWSQ